MPSNVAGDPLIIQNITKTYPNGKFAIKTVSFSVEVTMIKFLYETENFNVVIRTMFVLVCWVLMVQVIA